MKTIILTLLLFAYTAAQNMNDLILKDGRIYDTGFSMTEMSPNAPEELSKLNPLIGEWEVKIKSRTSDSTFYEAKGFSRFTYLNRGYSLMEKFYCEDFNGNGDELNTISFIVYNKTNEKWNIGIGNSYKENITLYTGEHSDGDLVVYDSDRKNGQLTLYKYKYSIKNIDENSFKIISEFSTDDSNEWKVSEERKYTKAKDGLNIVFENDSFGEYNKELPDEARQFDFLIGEWDAHHEILGQDGNYIKYNSTTTAVYVMNGNAIMEHDWFDSNRGMKDPGTSLLRIYNRATREWECLFLTNRANANYYFGGVKEGDDIVLRSFDTDASAPAYSYFVFYNISKDDYSWRGKRTTDRGKTFVDTWRIEVDKRK